MLKKISIITIILIVGMYVLNINYTFADDEEDENLIENEIQDLLIETATNSVEEPIINSKTAVIFDRETKQIIWGKEENTKRAMASTTKIMTALVVLENSNLSDTVTISKKAANTGGSRLKLNTGDKISVNDLLYGLMLRSRK